MLAAVAVLEEELQCAGYRVRTDNWDMQPGASLNSGDAGCAGG